MVFLTSVDILDTGFLTVASRTNQLPTASRVNSGTALRLKGATFSITYSGSLDKGITPGRFTTDSSGRINAESHPLISINPTEIEIKILLNNNNTDTNNPWGVNDMALLSELIKLGHTRGWKALYYPVDSTTIDSGSSNSRKMKSQIFYYIGRTDTSESQGDINISLWTGTTNATGKNLTNVYYLPVRFEPVKIGVTPNNQIEITMAGVVTI